MKEHVDAKGCQVFPFTRLPAELRLEIIRFAACPHFDHGLSRWTISSYYATAVALCSVSHFMRQETMPHLLRTVILCSDYDVCSFVDAVVQQQRLRLTSSRLAIDYTKYVRRFWCTRSWTPPAQQLAVDCSPLYPVIRNVKSFGVHIYAIELLYNALRHSPRPAEDWTCRRLTFAGGYWVWNPLTSTPDGLACLRQVTHLVLWLEDTVNFVEYHAPTYLKSVPFKLMPNLTHFAFGIRLGRLPKPDSETCRQWILEEHPEYRDIVKDLVIHPLEIDTRPSVWEREFLLGKNEIFC